MKAQINNVFTIIFSLLIMGLLVYFATKGISGLLNNKCDADYVKFETTLTSVIVEGKDYGAIDKHRIITPCNYYKLCFVDKDYTLTSIDTGNDQLDLVMERSTEANEQITNNVFLFDGEEVKLVGLIDEINIEDEDNTGFFCVESSGGRFTFVTEGKGKFTSILSEDDLDDNSNTQTDSST